MQQVNFQGPSAKADQSADNIIHLLREISQRSLRLKEMAAEINSSPCMYSGDKFNKTIATIENQLKNSFHEIAENIRRYVLETENRINAIQMIVQTNFRINEYKVKIDSLTVDLKNSQENERNLIKIIKDLTRNEENNATIISELNFKESNVSKVKSEKEKNNNFECKTFAKKQSVDAYNSVSKLAETSAMIKNAPNRQHLRLFCLEQPEKQLKEDLFQINNNASSYNLQMDRGNRFNFMLNKLQE